MTIDKTFDPAAIEARWYAHWEEGGLFRPARPEAEPFTIVIPPPNVTGSLHIGHALDNTLQDILVRHARLQGKDALWVVGTDHAGIATQMVVERQLNERQQKRTDFSREEFIAKVWEWKEESGGTITRQLRRLGERAFHDGRGLQPRRHQGVRRSLQSGPALSRQAAGELGSRPQDRDLGPRGRDPRGAGEILAFPLSAGRRLGLHFGGDDAAGDDACRHGGGGEPRG
jgi:hypothetical protein